jgi:hypothetical protein
MQVVGKINQVDEKSLPKPLGIGETVVYQLLGGVENPDPDARKAIPVLYPVIVTIPSKDRIKDKTTGKVVDIGVIENYNINAAGQPEIKYKKLAVFAKANNGLFFCTGGNLSEEEQYEYYELSNYNESNPDRDTSIEPKFKRVDEVKDSKQRNKSRNSLLEALKYFDGMTLGEMKELAASLNWNENMPPDILKDKIGEFAMNKPEDFKKAVMDKGRDVKAIIKQAITAGVIKYDVAQHRITLNGQTLIKLERVEGVDYLVQAADWMATAKNGEKTLATIKKLMDKPKADNDTE